MDLTQLRSFAAVARHRHFTRAAQELHLGQPAVSQHVRQLEAELGVELLSRTTRAVEVTHAGDVFLRRAERALAELEAGTAELDELKGLIRGRLTIGAMQWLEPYDLPATLAAFHARHAGVDIRVVEQSAREMVEGVLHDELDAAFVPVAEDLPADLSAHPLFEDELMLVCPAGSPLARRAQVALTALRGEDFVFLREGAGLRRAVEDAAHAAGFQPHVRFETNELGRVLALVAAGLGVSVVSRAAAEAAPGVAALSLRPRLRRRVALVWRTARRQPPAAAAFVAMVREDPAATAA